MKDVSEKQTFNIPFTGGFLDGSSHAVLDDMELDVREGLLRVRTGFPLDQKPDPDDPSYWDRLYSLEIEPHHIAEANGLVVCRR
jgi:hypothetical protein